MANLVTYAKHVWQDAKTAITAARLNNMEKGISDCANQINKLGDSVSQSTTICNEAVRARVGGNMSLDKPQPIQVAVQTATSDYVLCVLMDSIYLYNDAEEKVIWRITAPK